jgi:hypothetical protein
MTDRSLPFFVEVFSGLVVNVDEIVYFHLLPPRPNATSRFDWRVVVYAGGKVHEREYDSEEAAQEAYWNLAKFLRTTRPS